MFEFFYLEESPIYELLRDKQQEFNSKDEKAASIQFMNDDVQRLQQTVERLIAGLVLKSGGYYYMLSVACFQTAPRGICRQCFALMTANLPILIIAHSDA